MSGSNCSIKNHILSQQDFGSNSGDVISVNGL